MDALMAALVAGALAQLGDRPAWLAAILADRWRAPGRVIAAAVLALAVASGLAAALAPLVAAHLVPEAVQLLLALALLFQGAGGFSRARMPDRLDGWRLGVLATAALGLFILLFGDGLELITLALAARTPVPALAAVGATIGGTAVLATAALLGERDWLRLPQRALRAGAAVLFLIAGVALALGALRLV